MKIIFLDIDGVVCTHRSLKTAYAKWYGIDPNEFTFDMLDECRELNQFKPHFSCDYWPFDEEALSLLHKIVRENDDIKFVISSSWRMGETLESLSSKFRLKGLHIPIIDFTERSRLNRGEQINNWLQANREKYNVTQFCVLDDEVKFDIIQHIPSNVVETKFEFGFTENKYNEVMSILERTDEMG